MTPGRSSTGRAPSPHGADLPLEANVDMARIPPLRANTVRTPDHPPADAGLVEHLATAVPVLERGTVIEQMNSAAQALLDTSVQAARGTPLSDLVAAGELLDAIVRVRDTCEPLTDRALPVTLCTGRTRVVDCTVTPLGAANREPRILVEPVQLDRRHPITREERLLTQTAHARNLVRRLGHEIRNPLGGLRAARFIPAILRASCAPPAAMPAPWPGTGRRCCADGSNTGWRSARDGCSTTRCRGSRGFSSGARSIARTVTARRRPGCSDGAATRSPERSRSSRWTADRAPLRGSEFRAATPPVPCRQRGPQGRLRDTARRVGQMSTRAQAWRVRE